MSLPFLCFLSEGDSASVSSVASALGSCQSPHLLSPVRKGVCPLPHSLQMLQKFPLFPLFPSTRTRVDVLTPFDEETFRDEAHLFFLGEHADTTKSVYTLL